MLAAIWLLLSVSIALGQCLMLAQTDWVVHGARHQGLYAWCYLSECHPRAHYFALFTVTGYILSVGGFLFSVLLSIPYIFCTNYTKPLEISASIQFFAAIVGSLVLLAVPFDISDVSCYTQQLVQPSADNCKLGWAYGIACILGLVSMSCPVIARLVADQRRMYVVVASSSRQYIL